MRREELEALAWLEPWQPSPPGLEEELAREVGGRHPLRGVRAVSVGRRADGDDVLFFLPNHEAPLAVVHLTWTGRREASPRWPHTVFYSSLDEWVERCMKPDHLEAAGGGA